jgi:hypothetical protein
MIRRALVASLTALALVAWAAPAAAQTVTGTWLLDVVLDAGNGRASFVLRAEGNTIAGTYSGVLGDQDVTGTIEGNVVRFGFDSPDAGAVRFEGTITGDAMEGTCEYGALGTGSFSGTRSS